MALRSLLTVFSREAAAAAVALQKHQTLKWFINSKTPYTDECGDRMSATVTSHVVIIITGALAALHPAPVFVIPVLARKHYFGNELSIVLLPTRAPLEQWNTERSSVPPTHHHPLRR